MMNSKLKLYLSGLLMLLTFTYCSTTDTEISEEPQQQQLVKPELISPTDGAENQSAATELTWKSVPNAENYHLTIATDAEFDSVEVDELTESKSFKATLSSGSTYYWKVKPLNQNDSGPWSDISSFTTAEVEKEPVSVALSSPQNGAEVQAEEVSFEWEMLENSKYHFQLAEDESFENMVQDSVVENASIVVAELEADKQYSWRVSPILDSETGTWSEVYTVTTAAEQNNPAPAPSKEGFVGVQNGDFVLNGEVFRYAGTNAYHLPNYQKIDPSVVRRAMDAFEEAGVSVVRMWGFYDGNPQYSGDITLQPRPGEYNEDDLRRLDQVIADGKERGIRFVLTLINYWDQLGGICQYNQWAGQSCGSNNMTNFMNGDKQQKWFKDYISMLLNRVNTVTGVAYKDDPAIFSWEIMNEGRNRGNDPQIIRDWYQDIAKYIKSIDSNHMVSTGEEGFDEGVPAEYSSDQYANNYILRSGEGTSYVLNTAIPEIDYGTAHWYPSEWGFSVSSWGADPTKDTNLIKAQHAWMKDHSDIAESHGKPFLMGEYGYPGWGDSRVENVYDDFFSYAEEIELDGSLLWQFTADYTKCSEYGGNICWPGGRGDEKLYNMFKDHIDAMFNSK